MLVGSPRLRGWGTASGRGTGTTSTRGPGPTFARHGSATFNEKESWICRLEIGARGGAVDGTRATLSVIIGLANQSNENQPPPNQRSSSEFPSVGQSEWQEPEKYFSP